MPVVQRQDYFNVLELSVSDGYPHTFESLARFNSMKIRIEKDLSNPTKYSMGRYTNNFAEAVKLLLGTSNVGIAIFKATREKYLAYSDFPVSGDANIEKLFPANRHWYCIIKVYDDIELKVITSRLSANGLAF